MTRILMIVYGITAEQAAARAPAAQFAVTSVIAALFVWLDSNGTFDGVGRWMGRKLSAFSSVLSSASRICIAADASDASADASGA